jgi:hypothetical protein
MPSDRDRPDEDLDAAFAAIIAGWDDVPSLDDPVDRPAEHDDAGGRPEAGPRRRAGDVREPELRRPAGDPSAGVSADGPSSPAAGPEGPRDWVAPEEPDDDRYHPPEPPPLPRGDLVGRLAWGGVLLGPLFLLCAGLFWRDAPRLWLAVAVLAFVGGFVTLVLRLPADRDDSDGDDGAVV